MPTMTDSGEQEGQDRFAKAGSAPQIPGYEIVHTLGHGGTSAVYHAIQQETGQHLALKVLTLQNHSDLGAALARLEREAHIGRTLTHPDIVPVLDFGQSNQTAWIAMDLLDGFELTHALSDPSFGLVDRLNVVLRVGAALSHAHQSGIVHRDIKPSNIFMTRDGGVRLLDFGIAHVKVDLRLTQSGIIVGTPRYMAPEQVMGQDIDARTDIFSLGVVLYQALTGVLPWQGDTVARLIIEVATRPPRPLQEALLQDFGLTLEEVSDLADVVHTAIASAPEDRFQTMEAFTNALGPFSDPNRTVSPSQVPVRGAWSQRRVDWALARAARLQTEHTLSAPTPKTGLRRDKLDETLSGTPDRVWSGLLLLFVAGLAAAIYLTLN